MAEIINDKQVFSLFEVSRSVAKTLTARYQSAFWVKAEMNKLNHYTHSGHCYPELVEKKDGKIIAQTKSTLWKKDYIRINNAFKKTLNEPLKEGIKILFLAKISFDALYGFTLQILDIDPQFTLGDLEREKKETIQKLQAENIFDLNRKLPFPLLPQRIAIISVESSKGYADFLKIINTNTWNYKFFHFLFPSLLQGDKAAERIIKQLRRIGKAKEHFDVVAIIRGGGGDIGLSCYNNYELSKEIALFPIPVLTGIGHATNQTVAEMVSHYNAITPTKLAEFLIQKFHNLAVPLKDSEKRIRRGAMRIIEEQKLHLHSQIKLFETTTLNHLRISQQHIRQQQDLLFREIDTLLHLNREHLRVSQLEIRRFGQSLINRDRWLIQEAERRLVAGSKQYFTETRRELTHFEKNISLLHPLNVLKRGYSITRQNGKAVIDARELQEGDHIETTLFDGKIVSTITQITKP